MKERPILFSGAMVRAILDDRKSQTRRTTGLHYVNKTPGAWVLVEHGVMLDRYAATFEHRETGERHTAFCPYGVPGDRLWVRETWAEGVRATLYRATDGDMMYWKPSIHMPRSRSRISLENTEVRIEQVRSISGYDALCEGVTLPAMQNGPADPTVEFAGLWDSINAERGYGWAVNPWVWPVSFRRVLP